MTSDSPVFKKTCHVCGRPALTLDETGTPLCPRHADGFIGSESTYGTLTMDDLDEEGSSRSTVAADEGAGLTRHHHES